MQTAAITNRLLTSSSSLLVLADSETVVSRSGLLRHIVAKRLAQTIHSQKLFVELTNELIQFAEQALVIRDIDALDEVSQVLMNLPVDAARQIGAYYYAVTINRIGHTDEAKTLLQTVADNAPITYRARAIQTLGGIHHSLGQLDEALRFQLEVLRVASDRNAAGLQPAMMADFEIAIIKSFDGDHRGALSRLRTLSPLVNLVAKQRPFYFYAYYNALAIELGEIGHLEEAKAASQTALAGPFASAHPEWAETRQELEAKRTSATPSVVAINQTSEVIPAPQMQLQPCPVRPQPSQIRKRVFAFCWLSSRGTFHRPLVAIGRFIAIANCQTNRITLDQLGRCIRSRAPPA